MACNFPAILNHKNIMASLSSLQWSHNERDGVSNHKPHSCLHNRLFRRRSKKTSKLHVTCLCEGNSPGTGEFPAQRASNMENVSIWWRHHDTTNFFLHMPIIFTDDHFYWLIWFNLVKIKLGSLYFYFHCCPLNPSGPRPARPARPSR